ncbi:SAM_USH1G_HARP domain-containing protein Sans isoform X2 [Arctopsyche grandis]|uniref:SAM_USH1G_HARP domain-containing protein Sans isoform X2 n=1 Tax=Arctopsyche grandis TaxID=121162 RepID=UPI00406D9411
MSTDRFHKAAKDGLLDVLKEANRKDCNNRDEAGMTPTLWASFEGNLDALRLLCGRGGEPDKSDHFGNTALHLAAARGHKECVTFLVNFGANLFATDIDNHTAQELAAINDREDILRFLDTAAAKMEINDKKKVKSMKEKAKKECEKTLKVYNKRQNKFDVQADKNMRKSNREWENGVDDHIKMTMPHRPSTVLTALKHKISRSSSQGNLTAIGDNQAPPTFSALVGTVSGGHRGKSAVQKAIANKMRNGTVNKPIDDFKIGEVEGDGRRSIRSLTGLRRDSEVMYVGTLSSPANHQRGKIPDAFIVEDEDAQDGEDGPRKSVLMRSVSQPEFLAADDSGLGQDVMLQEPASIFERPGFGSVAFRRSITATLNSMGPGAASVTQGEEISIGSAGSLAARQRSIQPRWNDDALTESSSESSDEGDEGSAAAALQRFLAAWGLSQLAPKLLQEQIDLDSLMLLTENDMKSLGLPLGPYRKLVTAVQVRKNGLANPGAMIDSPL